MEYYYNPMSNYFINELVGFDSIQGGNMMNVANE